MIVERYVYKVKWGCQERLVAFLSGLNNKVGRSSRLYTPVTGRWPTVATDTEFESLDQREDWYAEVRARPDYAALTENLGELVESFYCELWMPV